MAHASQLPSCQRDSLMWSATTRSMIRRCWPSCVHWMSGATSLKAWWRSSRSSQTIRTLLTSVMHRSLTTGKHAGPSSSCASTSPSATSQDGVGGIMIYYRTHLLSPVQRADSAIRYPLLSSIFLTPKNPEVILEIIKFGFSGVSQIPSCLSQKIPFILTIPTVSSIFSYLLSGTRNGNCWFLCLHVLSQLPLDV